MRFMVDSGEGRDTAPPERLRARRGAGEFIGMVFHGYTVTHIDTPAHFFWEGKIYNGRSCNLITSREGATVEAVELLHDGVVSRGVLLDVARTRGVRWLEPGEGVMPADLETAERAAGVRIEPGDILVVRTGYYARRLAEGPTSPLQTGSPGPHAALLPWLKERGVAVWGSDTHNDVSPTLYPSMGSPFHIGALVGLGLWLVDNMNLEDIAAACTERSRWEFLLTLAPLRLRNVTGSPLNPIALF
jgi:kynurenine formamidase